jgi:hypothetical protein
MVASLLAVLSTGIQDERLALQPTLHPFTKVWNKTGRFTTKWERLDFENTPTFGSTAFLRLLRKGHLITRLYLVATMPDLYAPQAAAAALNGGTAAYPRFGWTNSLGHALVSQLTLDIAASRVETLDGRLLEILDEFHTPLEKVGAVSAAIRRAESGFTAQTFGWPPAGATPPVGGYQETVVVPLPFWFTRGDTGCALPIDAMSADDVRVGITFRGLTGLYYTTTQPGGGDNTDGTALWPILGSSFYAQDPVQVPNAVALGPKMPTALNLGECYVMAEYVYLDQNEANRFRLADLQVPVVQHYAIPPFDTQGLPNARIRFEVPNPTRDLYFFCQPWGAGALNAHFLATRSLTGNVNTVPNGSSMPWWPDAGTHAGFALSQSEPVAGYELDYEGSLVRFRTEGCALFRSILPSYEQRKTPWINRYYYNFPLGIQNGFTPFSAPRGEANLDKIPTRDLLLRFRPPYGRSGLDVGRFTVFMYAETYNMLRVYGGRSGMMF